ncbi:hypothetical protein LENED_006389 [Lentinula edodes]|uniref:Uncharacterized protein n=1 Tax=Lentinula edodes TaxID=5353 RepID=A0A1Q3EBJ0_LENED|nr:hypothetical protein LENED_006389 [Lentinula edodes]
METLLSILKSDSGSIRSVSASVARSDRNMRILSECALLVFNHPRAYDVPHSESVGMALLFLFWLGIGFRRGVLTLALTNNKRNAICESQSNLLWAFPRVSTAS